VGAATELEQVLGELGETPFEPLKEEQEEGVIETLMEHQVAALNNTLINFFRGSVLNSIPSSSSTLPEECQVCKGRDHIATTCPRLNEPRPKCAKCGMLHRTENCGVKFLSVRVSGIQNTGVRGNLRMRNRILERQISLKCC
jgi:hypothetical protein